MKVRNIVAMNAGRLSPKKAMNPMPNNAEGVLYVVATPIGNLEDITFRAIRTLTEVDMILCEDTRTTGILLAHYKIKNKVSSYHSHTTQNKQDKIIYDLKNGSIYALVSDAGTPGISDPGALLIKNARENDILVVPIPGVSAVTAIISASGITGNQFAFWGFVPQKKGRETFLKKISTTDIPIIIYESNHRIIKLFEWLDKNSNNQKQIFVIGRELTKMFETIVSGTANDILNYLKSSPKNTKGEFVIIAQK